VSTPEFEAFLARLYADPRSFGEDLRGAALRFGLTPEQAEAIGHIDREALAVAAASFERKRQGKRGSQRRSIVTRLLGH